MESNYLFVGLAEGDINIGYKKGTCLNDLKDKLLERVSVKTIVEHVLSIYNEVL